LQDGLLVALTGYAETADQLQRREAGIDVVLLKPVDSTVLETLLELERRRLGRSRRLADRARAWSRVPAAAGLAIDRRDVIPGRGPAATVT
jgi:CheY-like chemotaxis protein